MADTKFRTFAAFGEIMLRLSPPGKERLFQSSNLLASFGGGEANVLVSLAAFGHRTRFITFVPDNSLGEAVSAELRKRGVGTEFVLKKPGRLGIYFAEPGSGVRPSRILYDRGHSSCSQAGPGDIEWDRALAGVDWFHVTGITPALSPTAAALTEQGMRSARAKNIKVSLDLNFRSKLWNYGRSAPEVMNGLAEKADVLMANEEDFEKALGMSFDGVRESGLLDAAGAETATELVFRRFPGLEAATVTLRRSLSADRVVWSAVLRTKDGFWAGPTHEIFPVVDRIGSGDAFAAGFIHGWTRGDGPEKALAFAVAASCLKHTIPGDFNEVSEAEVMDLVRGEASGRIRR